MAESELATSLEHPNVVPIHDAGEVEGRLYLVMRSVAGSDLKALLAKEGPLEPKRALTICAPVAGALDAAHVHGLVHRDVKPSNVLLDEAEHLYLADFGLTRRVPEAGGLGSSLGTPAYAAPEQIEGGKVDGRADAYSLACLLALQRIDPKTNKLVATTRLGSSPASVAAGEGAVWVTDERDSSISRIDSKTNSVTAKASAGPAAGGPSYVVTGEGSVWVSNTGGGGLTRFDAGTLTNLGTLPLGSTDSFNCGPVTAGGGESGSTRRARSTERPQTTSSRRWRELPPAQAISPRERELSGSPTRTSRASYCESIPRR